MKREHCASAYIIFKQYILLIKHPVYQKWLPPGGHLEPNETPQQACVREVLEETGLHVSLFHPHHGANQSFQTPFASTLIPPFHVLLETIPHQNHQHIDHIFLAKPYASSLNSSHPHLPTRWWSVSQLKASCPSLFFPDTLLIAQQILDYMYNSFEMKGSIK